MYALTNCTLYTGSCVLTGYGVLIEGDKIVAISHLAELPADIDQIDLKGANLTAGFIDVQLNGCGGVMFNMTLRSIPWRPCRRPTSNPVPPASCRP